MNSENNTSYDVRGERATIKSDIEFRVIDMINLAAQLKLKVDMNKKWFKAYHHFRNEFFALFLASSSYITEDKKGILKVLHDEFYIHSLTLPDGWLTPNSLMMYFQDFCLILRENKLTEIVTEKEVIL